MKDKENAKYVKLGITGIAVVAVGLVGYFILAHTSDINDEVQKILGILMPFIYGAVMAYLLAPGCNLIERGLKKAFGRFKSGKEKAASALAIPLCFLAAFLVITALVLLVLPRVCTSIIDMSKALPGQIETASTWITEKLESYPQAQEAIEGWITQVESELQKWMRTDLVPMIQDFLETLGGQMAELITVVKNLFLGLMVSVYLLASRRKFAVQAKMLLYGSIPGRAADWIYGEVRYADKMFSGFLMGKLLDSAIIGGICFVVTWLMGIKSAVLVSAIVGVTNIIPFFGPYIGAIPCILLLLLENPLHCLYFTVFIIILQQIDGNIIGPKILGDSTGLSGFWVLFSILLFGGLWGFIGMIVGVPLFAVIYDIIRTLIFKGLKRYHKLDMLKNYGHIFGKK